MQVGHELYSFELPPEREMLCQRLDSRFSHFHKRVFILMAVLVVVTGCGEKQVAAPGAPPEVEVTAVVQQDVPLYTESISTLDGYVNAQIQPQVTGYLTKQNYQEGTVVQKGDVLFEIDPRPFEAALQQIKGAASPSRSTTWQDDA